MKADARWQSWLVAVRHDLVKHAVWRARDLRDLGRPPQPAELQALRRGLLALRDETGGEITATALWRSLRAGAELDGMTTGGAPSSEARGAGDGRAGVEAALDGFGGAVLEAEQAALALEERPESWSAALAAILALEEAFARLARALSDVAG